MARGLNREQLIECLEHWNERCRPDEAIPAGDERYVDFDNWHDQVTATTVALRGPARGPSAVEQLVTHILLEGSDVGHGTAQLFSGYPGSGKSSELARAAAELEGEGFTCLIVDASRYLMRDVAPRIDELLLVLVAGLAAAAESALGLALVAESEDETTPWWRLHRIGRLVGIKDLQFKLGPIQVRSMLRSGSAVREKLNALRDENPTALSGVVAQMVTRLREHTGNPLVLLVDGLEKFRAPTEELHRVNQAIADLFSYEGVGLRFPGCHAIYTVPPYLPMLNNAIHDEFGGGRLHTIRSVKVHTRPPERIAHEPGIRAMQEVLRRRVDLDLLFGASRDEAVRSLALKSGGHVRDLMHLMRALISQLRVDVTRVEDAAALLPVPLSTVTYAIETYQATRAMPLRDGQHVLERIRNTGSVAALTSKELEQLAVAMDRYLVFCYHNGEDWYDLHPFVLDRWDPVRTGDES